MRIAARSTKRQLASRRLDVDNGPDRRDTVGGIRDPEAHILPSERPARRTKTKILLAIVAAICAHLIAISAVVGLILLVFPVRLLPPPPPDRESMPIFVQQPKRVIPAETPPETNQIAEVDARAESRGPNEPQPAGGAMPREEAPVAAQREPSPQPPAEQPEPVPEPSAPEADELVTPTPDDQRLRLARALKSVGGDGDWGSLAEGGEGSASSGLGYDYGGADFQIESKADVDWGPWSRRVRAMVKGNWYSIMPVAARVGMKGIVKVRFVVHRDGAITDWEMLDSSGLVPLDAAVRAALVDMSNPLPPLPLREFDEDTIRITYTFIYNLSNEREMRAWQRQRWMEQRRQGGG
jgi:TonB family protein